MRKIIHTVWPEDTQISTIKIILMLLAVLLAPFLCVLIGALT